MPEAAGSEPAAEVHRHRVAFKTVYLAPNKYYFEWAEPPVGDPATATHRVSAFWTQGEQVLRLFYSMPGAQICPSLDHVIAGSAGISKGSSVTVASYLLPSLMSKMRTLFRFKELVRVDDCRIDGHTCHTLKGQNWNGGEEHLYIDSKEFLLRRTRVAFVIKPGVDEAQYEAIKRADPAQAEEYRKFRQSQTAERRFWNQIDYHQAEVNKLEANGASGALFKFDPLQESDLIPSFAVL
ncbi:MAG: hypothetical protein KGS72_23495 [Cyanobacteria bacterium REEB67]|nr:hypothetical protein [Cyanobacteria bacterium REEB67]